jgi:undecaprenyl diphosphate synthase
MDGLPKNVQRDLEDCMALTANNRSMTLNVAINYGARAEITDAARKLAEKVAQGDLKPKQITEEMFAQHLYLPTLPEPDLLIRTSGEMRLSNFMLWQLSYSEIVTQRVLWPDFRRRHLHKAIAEYQSRQRRFGGR